MSDKEPRCVLHLLRVTIEAASPLSIGSGDFVLRKPETRKPPASVWDETPEAEDDYLAAGIVRDANGLPVIPGSSLQGVLRRLYADDVDPEAAAALFGWADGEQGQAGRLIVGWGAIHDSANLAVVGRIAPERREDALLKELLAEYPLERDHVALNARHVVDGHRKFARTAVPRGARFSIEFALWGQEGEDKRKDDRTRLATIARLFDHPAFRLGGSSGRGYGRVRLEHASHAVANLADADALRGIRRQPPSEGFQGVGIETEALKAILNRVATVAAITLTPVNPWRVGGRHAGAMTKGTHGVRLANGDTPVIEDMDLREEDRDIQTIVREPSIRWENGAGRWQSPDSEQHWDFPIPGSTLKGLLAHRALYHFNRRNEAAGRVIDVETWLKLDKGERAKKIQAASARPGALERFLGIAKEGVGKQFGRAGRLLAGDGETIDVKAVQAIDHNTIDRFTGGVLGSHLFAEEVLVGGGLKLELTILPPFAEEGVTKGPGPLGWTDDAIDPFLDALADLCHGRLAIGAKSLGFCNGDVVWKGADRDSWVARWHERGRK